MSGFHCITSALTTQEIGQLCDKMTGSQALEQGGVVEILPLNPRVPTYFLLIHLEMVRVFTKPPRGSSTSSGNPISLVLGRLSHTDM